MTDTPPPDSGFSGIDLAKCFLPDWAKAADATPAKTIERFGRDAERPPGRFDDRGPRSPGRDRRDGGRPQGRGRQDGGRRDARGPRDARGGRPDSRRDFHEERRPEPLPVLRGWTASLVPDPRGVEGLARQIKSGGKAYPIFDLALLILEKPERYRFELHRESDQATPLFRLSLDGSLWTSEKDAARHALGRHLEKFYRRERVTVDPPKGSFSCVAVCGDTVLGPPNHHSYQSRLREVHAAGFRNMPFEAFKSRVRMVKDPDFIEKWKSEQSSKDEFYAAESPEGSEPVKFADMAAVAEDFAARHAPALIEPAASPLEVSGVAATGGSAPVVRQLAMHAVSELRRFPLPLAHILGQGFASAGLQIFKAHANLTYVGVARPRFLDRAAAPVADALAEILNYLESHPPAPRPEQWKALLALRTTPEGEAARESALASDLSWLIHQGHVMDYAKRGLEAVRKPNPPRDPAASERKKSGSKPASAPARSGPHPRGQTAENPPAAVPKEAAPTPSSPDCGGIAELP